MASVFDFPPTVEQQGIIEGSRSGNDLVVIARAGSGKTTSLEQIAHFDPKAGLYLVYNTANRKEAQARFPGHMVPKTGHGLAFKPMIAHNDNYRAKFDAANGGRRIPVWSIVNSAGIEAAHGLTANKIAGIVLRTISAFQYSADSIIGPKHVPENALPARFRKPENQSRRQDLEYEVTRKAGKIWTMMADELNPFPILHDTYLKLFQLHQPQLDAEQILVDEFQDANPVIKALIDNQEAQKIYVGDPCQAIYSWRGAINALQMERDRGTQEHNLSVSFRFGNQVASLANLILKIKGEQTLMRGAGPSMEPFDASRPHAIIARNNATLFEHAVQALEAKEPFALVGGADELVRLVRSGYALYRGDTANVRDEELRNYADWHELREISEITQDAGMRHLVMVIEKYKSESVDFCRDLESAGNVDESTVGKILTTAHRSKGREFPQTHLCEDLEINKETMQKLATEAPITEEENEALNLMYVALTRCKTGLHLEEPLKRNLQMMRRSVQAIEQAQTNSTAQSLRVG
jgi:hypothetical protein